MGRSLLRGIAVVGAFALFACGVTLTGDDVSDSPEGGTSSGSSGSSGASSSGGGGGADASDASDDVVSAGDGGDACAPHSPTCPCGLVCASNTCTNGGACDPLVFVTNGEWTGALGGTTGIAEGDKRCQEAADAANIKAAPKAPVFKAWLSNSTSSASARLTQTQRPYRMRNGMLVASSWAALVGGNPPTAITITETGAALGNTTVWTGTDYTGTRYSDHCSNWTESLLMGVQGGYGINTANGNLWSLSGSVGCTTTGHLYCLEQLP